ncbi:class I SAM-dependent methyltransferase [Nisaea acidiphila]|uniref:Class I SAM-dependent methyltransferase n=1 Tax=Nisaea acidiphila TaxID=1862145 RepID=A0A9J7AQD4_9PROT|nr:class I SAM-dependent methyltransferase [Nisaea acidiphila]UUX48809.1 class I SAM-dependent methyltransferase [Nisaea acidiphila]
MVKTKYLRRHFIEQAVKSFAPEGSVLEVGSGKRWRYFRNSTTLNRDAGAEPDVICDAEAMTFADGVFSNAVCIETLEHTPHPELLVKEVHRVLKPGGRILFTVPFVFEIHDEKDFFRFTEAGLRIVFKDFADLKIVSNGGFFCVIFHFFRLNPAGRILFPILNNLGYFLDWMFGSGRPRITLGYTVTASKQRKA